MIWQRRESVFQRSVFDVLKFTKAVELFPTRPHAVCNLGFTYATERNWQRAIDYYKQCLELSPAFFTAHFHMGDALYELGHKQEAIRSWETAQSINPRHSALKQRIENARK